MRLWRQRLHWDLDWKVDEIEVTRELYGKNEYCRIIKKNRMKHFFQANQTPPLNPGVPRFPGVPGDPLSPCSPMGPLAPWGPWPPLAPG